MNQTPLNRSRLDKFALYLDIPKVLKSASDKVIGEKYNADVIQYSVFGSPVPAINVPAIDLPYSGQVYKTSSFARPSYDPFSIKFLVDNGYKNYWILWNWLNVLNDYKNSTSSAITVRENSNVLSNPMTDYTSNFTVVGLDEYNNEIIKFKYTHAFPTSLSEISYSDQDPSEITSSVSFVFNQLEVSLLRDVNKVSC
jgi:hypothetical protein